MFKTPLLQVNWSREKVLKKCFSDNFAIDLHINRSKEPPHESVENLLAVFGRFFRILGASISILLLQYSGFAHFQVLWKRSIGGYVGCFSADTSEEFRVAEFFLWSLQQWVE